MVALNFDPSDLSLLSSKDYRCEPPAPGLGFLLTEDSDLFFNFLLHYSKSWQPIGK
jgi:hypothetical protein